MSTGDIDALIARVGAGRPRQSQGFISPPESVQKLTRAWISERSAPVLLPFVGESMAEVQQYTQDLAQKIEEASISLGISHDAADAADAATDFGDTGGAGAAGDTKMELLIMETALERLKFVMRGYLRARLAKIDNFLIYYRLNGEKCKLAPHEMAYVDRHTALLHRLYYRSFMQTWPEPLHDLVDTTGPVSMVDEPNNDKPVAIRVLQTVPTPVRVDNDLLTMEQGGVYFVRYSAIASLVGEFVELI